MRQHAAILDIPIIEIHQPNVLKLHQHIYLRYDCFLRFQLIKLATILDQIDFTETTSYEIKVEEIFTHIKHELVNYSMPRYIMRSKFCYQCLNTTNKSI